MNRLTIAIPNFNGGEKLKRAVTSCKLIKIPQIKNTFKHIRVSYSYYLGAPAPLTNGGLNEHGVAVRDIWSTSRKELINMTPKNQTGLNYSDLARIVLERSKSSREAVNIAANLIKKYGECTYGGNSHIFADSDEAWIMIQFAGGVGLWAAERLGPESIRVSRPGYIEQIPIHEKNNPNFLFSDNLIKFCKDKGWYSSGSFNLNKILGTLLVRLKGKLLSVILTYPMLLLIINLESDTVIFISFTC